MPISLIDSMISSNSSLNPIGFTSSVFDVDVTITKGEAKRKAKCMGTFLAGLHGLEA